MALTLHTRGPIGKMSGTMQREDLFSLARTSKKERSGWPQ